MCGYNLFLSLKIIFLFSLMWEALNLLILKNINSFVCIINKHETCPRFIKQKLNLYQRKWRQKDLPFTTYIDTSRERTGFSQNPFAVQCIILIFMLLACCGLNPWISYEILSHFISIHVLWIYIIL